MIKSWLQGYKDEKQNSLILRRIESIESDIHVIEEEHWLEEIRNKALYLQMPLVTGADARLLQEELLISNAKLKGFAYTIEELLSEARLLAEETKEEEQQDEPDKNAE